MDGLTFHRLVFFDVKHYKEVQPILSFNNLLPAAKPININFIPIKLAAKIIRYI